MIIYPKVTTVPNLSKGFEMYACMRSSGHTTTRMSTSLSIYISFGCGYQITGWTFLILWMYVYACPIPQQLWSETTCSDRDCWLLATYIIIAPTEQKMEITNALHDDFRETEHTRDSMHIFFTLLHHKYILLCKVEGRESVADYSHNPRCLTMVHMIRMLPADMTSRRKFLSPSSLTVGLKIAGTLIQGDDRN